MALSAKTSLVTFLLAVAAYANDGSSLNGTWQIYRNAGGNESTQECAITQKENALTGTCTTPGQAAVQISGKVDGKNVTFTYRGDTQGGMVTVVYNGAIESVNKISGKVTAVEYSIEGDFTATRTK